MVQRNREAGKQMSGEPPRIWPDFGPFQFDFMGTWTKLVRKLEKDISQMARNQTIIDDIKRQCGVTEKK